MAKKKETKVEEVIPQTENTLILSQEKFEHCEWCYQFDEDEPQIFAWTDETINSEEQPKVKFTIGNQKEAYISFSAPNGKSFKLFPRELTESGKQLRDKSKLKTNE